MTTKYFLFALLFLAWVPTLTFAQDDQPPKWEFRGYLKNLQTITNLPQNDFNLFDGQFHNRLNLKWFPAKNLTFDAELRTRYFYGETVKYTPGFDRQIGEDPGLVDMSWVVQKSTGTLLHTTFDRLWLEWQNERWKIRAGRQRINWGVATTWNPNDLFNTFNFLDFDYEERPGSDALLVQYFTGGFSGFDLAFNPGDSAEASVAAAKYYFNVRQYDLQVIGGWYKNDLVAGLAWAGNIGQAGFKGEASWFHPAEVWTDTTSVLAATAQMDYVFAGGWYVSGSVLFNSAGQKSAVGLEQLTNFRLSPKNLMPGRFTFSATSQKTISPILSAGGTVLFSPEINLLMVLPNLTYNLAANWDLDLVGQLFFAENDRGEFANLGNLFFMRVKWSY
jgi:hypothetical protein